MGLYYSRPTADTRQTAAESSRGQQRQHEGSRRCARQTDVQSISDDQDIQDDFDPTVFDRLLFLNMFKDSTRSLFRYPILGGLRQSHQFFPRICKTRYRWFPQVHDSRRLFLLKCSRSTVIVIGYCREPKSPW